MTNPMAMIVPELTKAIVDTPPAQGRDTGVRVGTVATTDPLTVTLQGGSVISPGVLDSYLANPGDTVALLRQDQTWLCLGSVLPGSTPAYHRRIKLLSQVAGILSIGGIPSYLRRLRVGFNIRTEYGAFQAEVLGVRINSSSATNYFYQGTQSSGAAVAALGANSAANWNCGVMPTVAGNGNFGAGVLEFEGWDSATYVNGRGRLVAPTDPRWSNEVGFGLLLAGAKTSIQFLSEHTANWSVGCDFQLDGWV